MNLQPLFDAIIADYTKYSTDNCGNISDYSKGQIENMKSGKILYAMPGNKYIRIVSNGGAWGFVVNTHDDSVYPYGTLLKAASWKAPARNGARGNVVTGDFSWCQWTGLAYKN